MRSGNKPTGWYCGWNGWLPVMTKESGRAGELATVWGGAVERIKQPGPSTRAAPPSPLRRKRQRRGYGAGSWGSIILPRPILALSRAPLGGGRTVAGRPRRPFRDLHFSIPRLLRFPPHRKVSPHMARILVIDDVDHMRRLLRITLEEAGHQVGEAREGREAMRLLREHPADLVFCDLFMNGQDGLETIRARPPRASNRQGGGHERRQLQRDDGHARRRRQARGVRRTAQAL